jgi:predicted outer membrane protein
MPALGTGFLWRRLWGPAVASIALVLIDPQVARAEPAVPDPPFNLLTDENNGELSAADKDFVVKVRLAGLWEIPAGDMAQDRSEDDRIKQIGRTIAGQHVALDELTRTAAKKLKVKLPNKPNADQQGWLDEMEAAEGAEFDQIYIDRLRAAHGKIFPAIATIRTSTRNDTVRKLAQEANQFVMTHLTLLESSGIVDYNGLPTAPPPNATTAPARDRALSTTPVSQSSGTSSTPLVVAALIGGLAVGIFATKRFAGNNRRRGGYRPGNRNRRYSM